MTAKEAPKTPFSETDRETLTKACRTIHPILLNAEWRASKGELSGGDVFAIDMVRHILTLMLDRLAPEEDPWPDG